MKQIPYRSLIADLASHFAAGDYVSAEDLPALTDDDLAVALNHDDSLLAESMDPDTYADILNGADKSFAERTVALGEALRADLLRQTRESLTHDVNDLLMVWESATPLERGMDEAGHRSEDFA